MNRNLMIAGAVVALVVIGAAAFMFMSSSKTGAPSTATPAGKKTTGTPVKDITNKGTIRSLIAKGGNVSCTITYPGTAGGDTKGTVFVSGQKIRSDMNITGSDGKNVDSHMIIDGGTGYFWSSMATKGTKMKIDMNQANASPTSGQPEIDKEVGYECASWTVDPSKFTMPAGIDFIDTSAVTPPAGGGTSGISKSACDALTDAYAKAACMANVK